MSAQKSVENRTQPITILLADDDADDRMMVQEACTASHISNDLRCVNDGEELMDYLYQRGQFSNPTLSPKPGLILLDLNMPKKDGREALKEIRADETLRRIPIVVLTTSHAEEDIYHTYDMGVNSYITKPVTRVSLVDLMKILSTYWFEIVRLPGKD